MWEGRNILIFKLKLCGKCWWKWVRNMGYRNVDWRLDGEDIFHSPLIGRLWSRLHPRTKTRPVHPPPPDRSIEASVGIQCSLFIVNTTTAAANNTLRHFTLIRAMCILPRQMEESWIVLVSRWLTHLSAKCGKTLCGCLRACTSA